MVERKRTNRVIFHHSLSKTGDAKTIREWHLLRKFDEIGYHYVVLKDGKVEDGRVRKYVGAHAAGRNGDSIGVCLVFDGRTEEPTLPQIDACCNLYHGLCRSYSKSLKVEFHRPHVFNLFEPGTYGRFDACPGKMLDRTDFLECLAKFDPYGKVA
jgi:hypothetical protein